MVFCTYFWDSGLHWRAGWCWLNWRCGAIDDYWYFVALARWTSSVACMSMTSSGVIFLPPCKFEDKIYANCGELHGSISTGCQTCGNISGSSVAGSGNFFCVVEGAWTKVCVERTGHMLALVGNDATQRKIIVHCTPIHRFVLRKRILQRMVAVTKLKLQKGGGYLPRCIQVHGKKRLKVAGLNGQIMKKRKTHRWVVPMSATANTDKRNVWAIWAGGMAGSLALQALK